jgi:hypothetical protein
MNEHTNRWSHYPTTPGNDRSASWTTPMTRQRSPAAQLRRLEVTGRLTQRLLVAAAGVALTSGTIVGFILPHPVG